MSTSTQSRATRHPAAETDTWTAAELHTLRDELEAEVDRLTTELEHLGADLLGIVDAGGHCSDDQADAGVTAFEQEQESSLAQHSYDLLAQTRHALQRMTEGSYMACEDCGRSIGRQRLLAFPRASLCLACKQRQEHR